MTQYVRAVMLTGYVEVARYVGLEPYDMLRRFRISVGTLDEPEALIPAATVQSLLETSAQESGCEDFGLLMAKCRTFPSLGPIALLLEHLSNMREVVQEVTEHRRHLNDILVLGLEDLHGTELLKIELMAKFASTQLCMLTLAVAHVAIAGASKRRWRPHAVHFTHPAPENVSMYKRYFAAPLQFGSFFNGYVSSHEAMTRRFPWANEAMAQHARRLLGLVVLHPEQSAWKERVSRAIVLLLAKGEATLTNVANHLAVTERTLQRELERENCTFAGILNEVRHDLVLSYLAHPKLSVTSIAELTGYSATSSFTRWFTSEFGMSPTSWRDAEKRHWSPKKSLPSAAFHPSNSILAEA